MRAMAASLARQTTNSSLSPGQEQSKSIIWAALALVCLVYALPHLLAIAQTGKILPIFRIDDTIYMVRTAAAMRGDTLGNPYIAGHENAPKYMPELSERMVALAGRALHWDVVKIAAAFRILQPAAIFLGVVWICWMFGFPPALAALAGLLTVLAPSLGMLHIHRPGLASFLRYARFLSAGFHTTLYLAATGAVAVCWQRPTRLRAILAGLAVGAIFYTPIFYWAVLWAGIIGLAFVSQSEQRRAMLVVAAISAIAAVPFVIASIRNGTNPLVQETLRRWPTFTMTPGRRLEPGILPHVVLCIGCAVLAWLLRRRSKVFLFLFAFFAATVPLELQNVVTNRQIQAYHFTDALNPLWAIMGVALLAQLRIHKVVITSIFALVIGLGAAQHAEDYLRLRSQVAANPQYWALNWCMPRTLAWLQANTASNSAVIAPEMVMENLPIFTHNKVYWAGFARQHVMPTEEADTRLSESIRWAPAQPLTYPVNYYLATGANCAQVTPSSVVFRDAQEGTCVWQRAR
jgi:MFS family permease